MCVLGYEITPGKPLQAYKKLEEITLEETQLWVILGETVRDQPVLMVKKWKVSHTFTQDIQSDFETQWPQYYNIRQSAKGQQRHPTADESNESQKRATPHCLIQFTKQI